MGASAARMAKRSGHAVSVGQEARRERPATGTGSPEPDGRLQITCDPYQAAFEVGRVAARLGPIVRRTTHVGRPWASR